MGRENVFKNDYYVITEDYKLVDFNEPVRNMYSGIKIGDYCYKATMKRDEPCLHCPIAKNSACDSPVYYDPFYKCWMEAIFSYIGDGKYAVSCRPAVNRGLRVFDSLGKDGNEELIRKMSGGAANEQIKKMEIQLENAEEEQIAQLEEITALNDQLQENQAHLEELVCEQEAQLEEIRALNEELDVQRAEIEARQMQDHLRLETISEAINGGFKISKNEKGYPLKYVSEKLAAMLGYTVEEFLATSGGCMSGIVNLSDIKKCSEAAIKNVVAGDMYTLNYRMRCKDGSWKYVEDRGRLIKISGKEDEIWSVVIDRDDLIQARVANDAKTTFLNNMSHDIRTPMNAILGFANLMETHTDEPEIIKNYLLKIEESGEYLLTLINNVLDMARIDSGKIELDEELMDMGNENPYIFDMLSEDIEKKHLKFTHELNIKTRYVLADETRISQVIINLLSNAIKYTPDGGSVHLQTDEVECKREGYAKYIISVSDTGIGMSKDYIGTIFDSFSRERTTTESKIIGTGLGMAIVKKYIDLMGGSIEVESEPGKGSTFRITIEHKIFNASEHSADNEREKIEKSVDFKGKRVLLAEDNDLNAEITMTILENNGFLVERAEDGVKCINMLNKAAPGYYSLILMDIQMPNLNGYMTTLKIRKLSDKDKSNIPIIAVTANAFENDKENALSVGMNGHLTKPIEVDKLIRTIMSILTEADSNAVK